MSDTTLILDAFVLDAALEEAQDGTVQLELPGSDGSTITLIIQGNDFFEGADE